MITASGTGPDGPVYIIGLSKEEIDKLKDMKNFVVADLAPFGVVGRVIIVCGATNETIQKGILEHIPLVEKGSEHKS